MEMVQTIDFFFKVRRCQPELIAPANPTPYEFKQLSDVDDQQSLRFHVPIINIYQHNPSLEGKDPVKVIKEAIAKTLVFYYPFAGRVREGPGRKLFVECTGEGILFIEADADVTKEQFSDALPYSLSKVEDIIYNPPNSDGILNSPLLLIQVTRLKCGGFIFAIRFNHTMTDAFGIVQFMKAIAEIARGAFAPSIFPVWQRTLLTARDPPRITCRHYEYDHIVDNKGILSPINNMVDRFSFFSPLQISALRQTLPTHLRHCSSFELITAYVWRLRTISLQLRPEEEVRFLCIVNLRSKFDLPLGYYGNALVVPAAVTTAAKLCENPLGYAVELIRKAKAKATQEYIKSMTDLIVIRGRPSFTTNVSFTVSDLTRVGFEEVDFGWGKAIFGGPTTARHGTIPGIISYCIPFMNKEGEKGIVVPLCLPAPAMERFMEKFMPGCK
ncbi:benzyl alcohol O-benzoyltransferase-like [Benincasa hispida]|uniref:benzyl alcohol O-benzoyltransferase-like n=1 Tax=Benincasa hispida TaxID=102211 RepID=UPI0019007FDD|nr:benzyl alcohol O-benzoyltransferase-like [Benincasa hispida]